MGSRTAGTRDSTRLPAAAGCRWSWAPADAGVRRPYSVGARAPLTGALADIDRLYLDRSIDAAVDGLPDIYALRDRLADTASAQDAVIEALSRQLPGE